jgi:hypothetical protein
MWSQQSSSTVVQCCPAGGELSPDQTGNHHRSHELVHCFYLWLERERDTEATIIVAADRCPAADELSSDLAAGKSSMIPGICNC